LASQLYWINQFAEGNLAIMPAPKAGLPLDEVMLKWKAEGVDVVVSLVESTEIPGLAEAEGVVCDELSLEFVWFPIRDKSVPSADQVAVLACELAKDISAGKSVAIHCRAGIGRSTLLAACVLICLGHDGARALDMIAEARGIEVPETEEQRQWILSFVPKVD
jgi:protein-tyrosine phosphatase